MQGTRAQARVSRIRAREMMENMKEVEMLRTRDVKFYGREDGPSFDYLVNKAREARLMGDEIYEFIIMASSRSNLEINRLLDRGR